MKTTFRKFMVVAVLALVGCGGPSEGEGPSSSDYTLRVTQDRQRAPAGGVVNVEATVSGVVAQVRQLQAQGTVSAAQAGEKILVNFVVTEGGGSVWAGSALVETGATAKEIWTLGKAIGRQTMEVRAVDQTTGEPIVYQTIEATALPGEPEEIMPTPYYFQVTEGTPINLAPVTLSARDSAGMVFTPPQEFTIKAIRFEGEVVDEPTPTCQVEGLVITCPKTNTKEGPDDLQYHKGAFAVVLDTVYETDAVIFPVEVQ